MKLQLRELKAARSTMSSQGLGPRQSVLPLLISFLFSHIVLAELSFLSPPASTRVLLLSHPPSFLFPSSFSSFFFHSPFPLHISLSSVVSPYLPLVLSLAAWESARAIHGAREEVLIPVSRTMRLLAPFASLHDRSCLLDLPVEPRC